MQERAQASVEGAHHWVRLAGRPAARGESAARVPDGPSPTPGPWPHASQLRPGLGAQGLGPVFSVILHDRVPALPGGWASAGSERVRLWAPPACLAGERATVLPAPWGVLGAPEVPVAFPGGSAAAASTGDFPPRQGLSLSAVSGGRAPRTGERSPRGRLGWWPESVSQTRDRSLRALFLQTEPGRGLKRCPSTSFSPEQKRRVPGTSDSGGVAQPEELGEPRPGTRREALRTHEPLGSGLSYSVSSAFL